MELTKEEFSSMFMEAVEEQEGCGNPVEDDMTIDDLGFDSLDLVELDIIIEKKLGSRIDLDGVFETFDKDTTVEQMAEALWDYIEKN